jgi:hypothetical protein
MATHIRQIYLTIQMQLRCGLFDIHLTQKLSFLFFLSGIFKKLKPLFKVFIRHDQWFLSIDCLGFILKLKIEFCGFLITLFSILK